MDMAENGSMDQGIQQDGEKFAEYQDAINQLMQIQAQQGQEINLMRQQTGMEASQAELLSQMGQVIAPGSQAGPAVGNMQLNPATQQILQQYGLGQPQFIQQPGSSMRTPGQGVMINNNYITNNVAVPADIGGPVQGRPLQFNEEYGKLQNWMSNVFARQDQERMKQLAAYDKKERELTRSSNKLLRKIGDFSKTLGEAFSPKQMSQSLRSHFKALGFIFGLNYLASNWEKLMGYVKNIGEFFGIGKEKGNLFDRAKDFFFGNDGVFSKVKDYIKAAMAERIAAVKGVEFPDLRGGSLDIPAILSKIGSYFSNVLSALVTGNAGLKAAIHSEKVAETAGTNFQSQSEVRLQDAKGVATDSKGNPVKNTFLGDAAIAADSNYKYLDYGKRDIATGELKNNTSAGILQGRFMLGVINEGSMDAEGNLRAGTKEVMASFSNLKQQANKKGYVLVDESFFTALYNLFGISKAAIETALGGQLEVVRCCYVPIHRTKDTTRSIGADAEYQALYGGANNPYWTKDSGMGSPLNTDFLRSMGRDYVGSWIFGLGKTSAKVNLAGAVATGSVKRGKAEKRGERANDFELKLVEVPQNKPVYKDAVYIETEHGKAREFVYYKLTSKTIDVIEKLIADRYDGLVVSDLSSPEDAARLTELLTNYLKAREEAGEIKLPDVELGSSLEYSDKTTSALEASAEEHAKMESVRKSIASDFNVGYAKNDGDFAVNDSVNYLKRKFGRVREPGGKCGAAVGNALAKGGIDIRGKFGKNETRDAKNYNKYLPQMGFHTISNETGINSPNVGDVVVIGETEGHPDGHVAMYTGPETGWVSDFNQKTWHGLKSAPPADKVTFYRYNGKYNSATGTISLENKNTRAEEFAEGYYSSSEAGRKDKDIPLKYRIAQEMANSGISKQAQDLIEAGISPEDVERLLKEGYKEVPYDKAVFEKIYGESPEKGDDRITDTLVKTGYIDPMTHTVAYKKVSTMKVPQIDKIGDVTPNWQFKWNYDHAKDEKERETYVDALKAAMQEALDKAVEKIQIGQATQVAATQQTTEAVVSTAAQPKSQGSGKTTESSTPDGTGSLTA